VLATAVLATRLLKTTVLLTPVLSTAILTPQFPSVPVFSDGIHGIKIRTDRNISARFYDAENAWSHNSILY
jgi:hypothetical protein